MSRLANVEPPVPGAAGKFDVCPEDVAEEIALVLKECDTAREDGSYAHTLVVRRIRETMNTAYRALPAIARRRRYNPAFLHPDDLKSQGSEAGDAVEIISPHGSIPAIVEADETVRPGAVSMTYGYGGMPGKDHDYRMEGASTCLLVSADQDLEAINAMARMTAVPVRLSRRES
jgi:anaerobic selenocysteine-containing dehydrogenase